mmetsp:Transcript_12527/g.42394  ORF Transcript_12527/g.42394 Transcript_12527/m.42394 type:complete len:231 (+) Transcript_12527:240-932(+)
MMSFTREPPTRPRASTMSRASASLPAAVHMTWKASKAPTAALAPSTVPSAATTRTSTSLRLRPSCTQTTSSHTHQRRAGSVGPARMSRRPARPRAAGIAARVWPLAPAPGRSASSQTTGLRPCAASKAATSFSRTSTLATLSSPQLCTTKMSRRPCSATGRGGASASSTCWEVTVGGWCGDRDASAEGSTHARTAATVPPWGLGDRPPTMSAACSSPRSAVRTTWRAAPS